MSNNKKNSYKGFVRSTSNTLTATNHYQVSLPPHVWKTKMGWKLNEKVRILTNKADNTIIITKGDE
jgi:hypothetical protein